MHLLKKCLELALEAHMNQKDKAGKLYVTHLFRVAGKMDTEEEMCVAILHDILEDTDMTPEVLLEYGIPQNIVEAVNIVSRDKNIEYLEFIRNIKNSNNSLAIKLKVLDLQDNLSRPESLPQGLKNRYLKSLDILQGQSS